MNLTALARKQWTGFDGAPSTQTLAVHTPLKNEKVALGLLFVSDKVGVSRQTGAHFSYAYRLQFPQGTLSTEAQAGFSSYQAELSSVTTQSFSQQGIVDPSFATDEQNRFLPNFGTGVHYYSDRFYAGFSVPQLIENRYGRNSDLATTAQQARHYLLTGGYVFDLSPSLKAKPNVLVKATAGAPVQLDLNTNFLIKEVICAGILYRSFESVNAILQLQLTNQLRLGYAGDFRLGSKVSGFRNPSHELMLNYQLMLTKTKVVTPRYF